MKTKSFLLGAAALMLATSCSNDEVVKVAENSAAIGFSSFVNNSTRADYGSSNLPENLQVWGVSYKGTEVNPFAVFTGDEVSKNGSAWTYNNLRYWILGNSYTFAAVAPANTATVTPQTATTGAIESVSFTNDGETDLLYATQEVEASDEIANYGTVNFTFNHMLSKVQFEFVNGMNETYKILVSDVTLENVVTKANVNKAEGETVWEAAEDNTNDDFTFKMDGEVKANKESAVSAHKYLFPLKVAENGGTAYTATFTIKVMDAKTGNYITDADGLSHTVTLPAIAFKAGYSYNFKTTVDGDNVDPDDELNPIVFNVQEISGWTPALEGEYNLKEKETNN